MNLFKDLSSGIDEELNCWGCTWLENKRAAASAVGAVAKCDGMAGTDFGAERPAAVDERGGTSDGWAKTSSARAERARWAGRRRRRKRVVSSQRGGQGRSGGSIRRGREEGPS